MVVSLDERPGQRRARRRRGTIIRISVSVFADKKFEFEFVWMGRWQHVNL
jgi:hypothetical protein